MEGFLKNHTSKGVLYSSIAFVMVLLVRNTAVLHAEYQNFKGRLDSSIIDLALVPMVRLPLSETPF